MARRGFATFTDPESTGSRERIGRVFVSLYLARSLAKDLRLHTRLHRRPTVRANARGWCRRVRNTRRSAPGNISRAPSTRFTSSASTSVSISARKRLHLTSDSQAVSLTTTQDDSFAHRSMLLSKLTRSSNETKKGARFRAEAETGQRRSYSTAFREREELKGRSQ